MDPEITKAAVEVTTKVAESLVPEAFKTLVSKITFGRGRKTKPRSERDRRQGAPDRRLGDPIRRLRKGFWLAYHRKVEAGKFDILPPTLETRDHLFQALAQEAAHYQFYDRGSGAKLDAASVIDSSMDALWLLWKSRPKLERRAIVFIEEMAAHVASRYNVTKIDRRKGQRRKAASA
jgi:hypothetical protein